MSSEKSPEGCRCDDVDDTTDPPTAVHCPEHDGTWRADEPCGEVHDPTTAAIIDQIADRDRLRAEVRRLSEIVDGGFDKGYDQAVQEIRDHFASRRDVVAEIDEIWKISLKRRTKIS